MKNKQINKEIKPFKMLRTNYFTLNKLMNINQFLLSDQILVVGSLLGSGIPFNEYARDEVTSRTIF